MYVCLLTTIGKLNNCYRIVAKRHLDPLPCKFEENSGNNKEFRNSIARPELTSQTEDSILLNIYFCVGIPSIVRRCSSAW
jgi:hypothetical protein